MANEIKGQDGREIFRSDGPAVNVWVVDDDHYFRELLKRVLDADPSLNCSHQFSSAPLVLAALQLLPPPEVIMLDIHMPEMTGIEALPRIKQLAPTTAVLMVSTLFDLERRQQAMAAGAWGCYRKTESATQLKVAIHAACKNPSPAPGNIPPPVTGIAKLRQFLFRS